jgi:hypothetical protein
VVVGVLPGFGKFLKFARPIAYRQRADLNSARENPCSFPSLESANLYAETPGSLGLSDKDFTLIEHCATSMSQQVATWMGGMMERRTAGKNSDC